MALTIEDGSIVAGANSYISVQDARDYALARGLTLPVDDTEVEHLVVRAFDYLQSLVYKGSKVEPYHVAEFPRNDLYVQGILFPNDSIPHNLITAQCDLTFQANSVDLLPTGDGREVVREKVDVVEVEYSAKGSAVSKPVFTKAASLLKDLLALGAGQALTLRI